ncbi:MAG: DUF1003 domain-containing protein [Phenylobacterium sp.]|uniref:DUF1003 domain-containing protein n=1 Tax=Phenylobacterium sp. TaxID=1871053 RepID=UPI00271D890B|nr:DUF1003 domain-containing protein [Phenylobacterium sp.]MDO9430919.1 DUF1003 domain-containing protein [Phenylobacterium sp.]
MKNGVNRSDELAQGLLNCSYEGLNPLQKSVIDLIAAEAPSGADPILSRDDRTFGQRLADRVASIGGSWAFIIGFGVALALWIGWNQFTRGGHLAFDPYPFIFLNLMLSMLAAIQAPVIMMSQNRQSAQDRRAAEHDYVVNLRAELEIMHLHDKMDAMRSLDLARLIEAQNQTIDLLQAQIARLASDRP